MANTILQLWNGSLAPIRHLGQNNSEMKQLERLIQRNLDSLEESIGEKSKALLEKYSNCLNEYLIVMSGQAFCDGFCLGAKIAAEALLESDDTQS